eukprot:CAMPEP_0114242522 /NCGR_PEP_ID=MMETSP0058-20121206/10222_1 /TAXON_ID=36894 /ORGANISM="Pyramimonas parkeae, CCMP726" /LENGTH=282 /DNA_ID=CAMNT_0001355143 /DNA_START=930 /DNA_END=1778 /DNA_ORIENTATION=-
MMAPQVWKVYRTHSARDLSWGFLAVYACGLTLLLVYEVSRGLWALYVPQSFEFTMLLAQITMKFVYDRKQRLRELEGVPPSPSPSPNAHPHQRRPEHDRQDGTRDSWDLCDPSNPFSSPIMPKTNHVKLLPAMATSVEEHSCQSTAVVHQDWPPSQPPSVYKTNVSCESYMNNPFASPTLRSDISSNPFVSTLEMQAASNVASISAIPDSPDEDDCNPFLAFGSSQGQRAAWHKSSASGNPFENGNDDEDNGNDCGTGLARADLSNSDISVVLNPLSEHGLR